MKTKAPSWLAFVTLLLGLWAAQPEDIRAELPKGVIAVERQLGEWREKSAFWVEEAGRVYTNNPAAMVEIKVHYIEASAIANSLIDQLKLQLVSRSPIDPKQYDSEVARAKAATEALAQEGRKLLQGNPMPDWNPVSRGKSRGPIDYVKIAANNATNTVAVIDNIMYVFTRHRKAFLEVEAKQRDEVGKLLDQRRWKPLKDLVPQKP